MEITEILKRVDHTIIKQGADWAQTKQILDEAMKYGAACACIPPAYLADAREYVGGAIKLGTVVGFPYGYSTTAAKMLETREALENGADEIDMVINIGWLHDGEDLLNLCEIAQIKDMMGSRVLKVIIEACLLTDEEKIRACKIITDANADYIKTSTGLAAGGATEHDIRLFAEHIGLNVKIKAAGGVNTPEQAQRFIELGASRVGSSRIIEGLEGKKSIDY